MKIWKLLLLVLIRPQLFNEDEEPTDEELDEEELQELIEERKRNRVH